MGGRGPLSHSLSPPRRYRKSEQSVVATCNASKTDSQKQYKQNEQGQMQKCWPMSMSHAIVTWTYHCLLGDRELDIDCYFGLSEITK